MNNGFFDEFKNAWDKPNNALVQIIIINVVIFVVLLVLKVVLVISQHPEIYQAIVSKLMLPASIPYLLKQPWTIVTYFFTHEGFLHIIFNMLFLFWFGRIIQEFLGQNKVIALYVLGGLAGGLFYILIYNIVPFYQGKVDVSIMLGASAGVYAVVVGAATFMPNYTFFLLFLGPVKIKYIAVFFLLMSFSLTIGNNAGGELAHLAGAGIGFLYINQLNQGNDLGNWIIQFIKWIKSFFVSKPKIKVTHRNKAQQKAQSARTMNVEADQDEIDAILDKISQSGYESLSKDEKQKLFNASKK